MVAGPPEAGSAIARTTAATRVTTVSTQSAQASALSLLLTANLRSPDPVIAHPVSIARPSSAPPIKSSYAQYPAPAHPPPTASGIRYETSRRAAIVTVVAVEITLLGPPRGMRDGEPVAFDPRKAMALLAHLALADRPRPREALCELLWPNHDLDRARGALRRTLSTLRRAIGEER